MPIYEYVCTACGKPFEHFARTLSARPERCPNCGEGGEHLKKRLSVFAAKSESGGCANAKTCNHAHVCNGCCCHG